MSFLKLFKSKLLNFLQSICLSLTLGNVDFKIVKIILWKSDKPLAKVIVFGKLLGLLVTKKINTTRIIGAFKLSFLLY